MNPISQQITKLLQSLPGLILKSHLDKPLSQMVYIQLILPKEVKQARGLPVSPLNPMSSGRVEPPCHSKCTERPGWEEELAGLGKRDAEN